MSDLDPSEAERGGATARGAGPRRLVLSERFVSLQGEGASAGEPAAFVRLMHCNLACSWCDTPYTWDFDRYPFESEAKPTSFEELTSWLFDAGPRRIIWTGGEPLVQQKPLARFVDEFDRCAADRGLGPFFLEVETNGTLDPPPELLARIDQWNVSPKLASAGDPRERRLRPEVLRRFAATGRAFFKFVVEGDADLEEVRALVREFELPEGRVLLMPEARTPEELRERMGFVAGAALREGYRYGHRLHLELYGGRRGT